LLKPNKTFASPAGLKPEALAQKKQGARPSRAGPRLSLT